MAYAFAQKGSVVWLLVFAFSLGFGTTVAEPALIAVAKEAAIVAATGGMIEQTQQAMDSYAIGLRYTVAISVGGEQSTTFTLPVALPIPPSISSADTVSTYAPTAVPASAVISSLVK